jgi:REP element-mobilizing transposase RayT
MAELWHVTMVTHNSRYSERMKKYRVKASPAFWLEPEDEVKLCGIIGDIVEKYHMKFHQFNICGDHAHILMEVEDGKLEDTVKTLKSLSALGYKRSLGIAAKSAFHLWAQKFNKQLVDSPEYLKSLIQYISSNRLKHGMQENANLETAIGRLLYKFPEK